MSSNALILVGGSDTLQCDGTLIRPGVGLTMAQLMNAGGKVVTRVLNTGYKGPYNPKNHIQDFFSEGEARERALDELYKADRDDLTKQHKQLLKHCHALLEYALPEYTVKTQLITFKILVAVITRYPGIRWLFHHTKCSKKASPLTASHFENLWNRPHQQCGEEWTFYRDFAVYCLTDGGPLTKLVESELPSKFGLLKHNWAKDPIETLLSFCSTDSPLNTEKLCAIRYLAGILELPKFWRLKTEERIDIEKRLFGFLSRLCETNFQLIRDTEPSGSGHSEDDPSPLWTSARSAVDILAFTTFSGFLQLHGLYEELPPCPSQLPSMVTLLIRPQMGKSFPKASSGALQCKEILYWQQDAGTNPLHVPPDTQSHLTPQSERQNTETNSLHHPDAQSLVGAHEEKLNRIRSEVKDPTRAQQTLLIQLEELVGAHEEKLNRIRRELKDPLLTPTQFRLLTEDYQTISRQIQDATDDAERIKTLTTWKPPKKLRQIFGKVFRSKTPRPASRQEKAPAPPRVQDRETRLPQSIPEEDIVLPRRNPTISGSSRHDPPRTGSSLNQPGYTSSSNLSSEGLSRSSQRSVPNRNNIPPNQRPPAWGVSPPIRNQPPYSWPNPPPPRSYTAHPDGRRTSSTSQPRASTPHTDSQGAPSLQYDLPPMTLRRLRRRSGSQPRNDNDPGQSSQDAPPVPKFPWLL